MPLMSEPLAAIREQFALARQAGLARHRDIAAGLHLTEGELIAAHVDAEVTALMRATRLRPHWVEVLTALAALGEVMALTRNAACVHEKEGRYAAVSGTRLRGVHLDLDCHFMQWHHGFAVEESGEKGVQRSLQFYDATGMAVHKVFLRPHSDLAAYQLLVRQYADANQQPGISVQPLPAVAGLADFSAFLTAWGAVHDARDLHALLAQSQSDALPYLQLMPAESAWQVSMRAANTLLQTAAAEAISIVILVGNIGVTQAHTGPVDHIAVMGPWLNVLDPGFNLHVREDHIASAWVVVQSGLQGLFSSLILLDQSGGLIALMAADRAAAEPEAAAWIALIDRLPKG